MGKIVQDLRSIKARDPACRNIAEVIFLYSGFHALVNYRISHFFYKHKLFFIARLLSQLSRFFTAIEIHPGATIGRGLFIDHGSGVVIGETAEIGDECTLYQGVTLGGTGKNTGKRHPTLGNDVLVGAGSKVLGPVVIGSHAKIAAGAVVLHDIPRYATAVGVPARVVRIANERVDDEMRNNDLDQTHVPDPIAQELCRMGQELVQMRKELDKMREELGDREG